MDSFFVLIGLVVLAFPIIAIVALVKALGSSEQVRRIELRLAQLERRLAQPLPRAAQPPELAPAPSVVTPTIVEPAREEAPAEPPAPPPLPEPTIAASVPRVPPAAAAATPAMSLEERLGTQWAVWVGGLALALGGIFIVRFSIEQGLLGPGVRITLGALLAIALIVVGEWARRTERLSGMSGLPAAYIPGVLTAAGTAVAFADVYAAYALYQFLPPGAAFILLGVVALATLAAAL
ncbi:MAG TPA: DUF2339 domain-containing protein, partial [Xanthobacteraceae bacterium]|nr:DUF2339 domain-containing protein [Xanthobacteraceae bacterium]